VKDLGVCIETFFSDLDYRSRLEKIHQLGFRNYEFWFHDKRFDGSRLHNEQKDFDMFADLNAQWGMKCTDFIFNHPDGGVVGALIDKRDRSFILDSLGGMIELAEKIGCKAFISGSGNVVPGLKRDEAIETMTETLSEAARICERHDITLLLEPFNTKIDHPLYFLDDPQVCIDVIKTVNHKNVRMLFDIYHMQIMAGNITEFIRRNIEWIGHFHVAGVPGRHEPKNSELNYVYIVGEIEKLGYRGSVGLEYWPTVEPAESLRATKAWLGG